MIGGNTQLASPQMDAFRRRMEMLNSLPQSNTMGQAVNLAHVLNPNIAQMTQVKSGQGGEGYWQPGKITLLGDDPKTRAHEYAHDLQWQTGIGTVESIGRGKGPYAEVGRVPKNIAEAAADVVAGTRGYLPDLTAADRSKANSIAKMMLAAAREQALKKGKKK